MYDNIENELYELMEHVGDMEYRQQNLDHTKIRNKIISIQQELAFITQDANNIKHLSSTSVDGGIPYVSIVTNDNTMYTKTGHDDWVEIKGLTD